MTRRKKPPDKNTAARLLADRVVQWTKDRSSDALTQLKTELLALAESYEQATVPAAERAAAERVQQRVVAADLNARRRRLLSPYEGVRIHKELGPLLFGLDSYNQIIALDETGRSFVTSTDDALALARTSAFTLRPGPIYPPAPQEECSCHRVNHAKYPTAKPCIGRCGRVTASFKSTSFGYCRFCSNSLSNVK
jgi:hypothetical protein